MQGQLEGVGSRVGKEDRVGPQGGEGQRLRRKVSSQPPLPPENREKGFSHRKVTNGRQEEAGQQEGLQQGDGKWHGKRNGDGQGKVQVAPFDLIDLGPNEWGGHTYRVKVGKEDG